MRVLRRIHEADVRAEVPACRRRRSAEAGDEDLVEADGRSAVELTKLYHGNAGEELAGGRRLCGGSCRGGIE